MKYDWTGVLQDILKIAFGVDANGHNHDGDNSRSIKGVFTVEVADLAAGGDLADIPVIVVPTGMKLTLDSVHAISRGTAAGVDDANTAVLLIEKGTNAVVSKTFNTGTAFPADKASVSLGALSATHKVFAAGEVVTYSVTNGATADLPAFALQFQYHLTSA